MKTDLISNIKLITCIISVKEFKIVIKVCNVDTYRRMFYQSNEDIFNDFYILFSKFLFFCFIKSMMSHQDIFSDFFILFLKVLF